MSNNSTDENVPGGFFLGEDPAEGLRRAGANIVGFMGGVQAELAKSDAQRGMHTTELLGQPLHAGFGTYTEKLRYTDGCDPMRELSTDGVGMVSCRLTNGAVVSIMKTPGDYRASGTKRLPDAGAPSDFAMSIDSGAHTDWEYLTPTDMNGLLIENDAILAFPDNPERQEPLESPGVVVRVFGFR